MKLGPFMSNVSSTMGSTLGKIAKVSSKIGKLGSFGTVGKFGRKLVPDFSRKKVLSSVGINLTEFGEKVVSNLTDFEAFMQSKNVSETLGAKLDEMVIGCEKWGILLESLSLGKTERGSFLVQMDSLNPLGMNMMTL